MPGTTSQGQSCANTASRASSYAEIGPGNDVLVRTPTSVFALRLGRDVRILGVRRVVDPDEEESLIAALENTSEVLELTGSPLGFARGGVGPADWQHLVVTR